MLPCCNQWVPSGTGHANTVRVLITLRQTTGRSSSALTLMACFSPGCLALSRRNTQQEPCCRW